MTPLVETDHDLNEMERRATAGQTSGHDCVALIEALRRARDDLNAAEYEDYGADDSRDGELQELGFEIGDLRAEITALNAEIVALKAEASRHARSDQP